MAFSQTQLDSLDQAIADGALEVKYRDRTVIYRSLKEMLQIRDLMRKDLGIIQKGATRVKASFSKGLDDSNGRPES